MRVLVNFERCRSNGICADLAPEIFEVRSDGYLYLLKEDLSGNDISLAADAVNSCPTQALSLLDP